MTRLGLVAYSTDTGLGKQTLDIYRHLTPHKTLVVDIQTLNGAQTHHDRYPDARITEHGLPTHAECDWLTDDIDTLIVCETPLNYGLFDIARQKNVRTILQYNVEFLDYLQSPHLPLPDLLAAPTHWLTDVVEHLDTKVELQPVPIDTTTLTQNTSTQIQSFGHIVGRPATNDRNGTRTYLEASHILEQTTPGIPHHIYIQSLGQYYPQTLQMILDSTRSLDITLHEDVASTHELYDHMDCLVLPRRFGGLCLPAQEAIGSHIPVIMSDISPNETLIPRELRIPATQAEILHARTDITCHDTDSHALADTMQALSDDAILYQKAKHDTRVIAEHLSWDNQKQNWKSKL